MSLLSGACNMSLLRLRLQHVTVARLRLQHVTLTVGRWHWCRSSARLADAGIGLVVFQQVANAGIG
eukprot:2767533-Amphidinium_carterae.1